MRRVAIFPLLGPALVLYLIADVAASLGRFDPGAAIISATAVALSLAGRLRERTGDARAERIMPWLGLSAAVALLRTLSERTQRLSVDLAEVMALALLGALVLDLALGLPDRLGSIRFTRAARAATYTVAGASALVSVLAHLPAHWLFGPGLLLPASFADASACFAALCVVYALGVRLARPRLGSTPDALAGNAWGVLALGPAAALVALLGLGVPPAAAAFMPPFAAVAAVVLYGGHQLMVDPRTRFTASRVSRDSVAALCTVFVVASAVALFSHALPDAPLPLALWTSASLFLSVALFFSMRVLVRRALAPFGGRMLDALASAEPELAGVQTTEELARVVLRALRRASGSTHATPILYGFDPTFEARLDAAGAVHVRPRPPHEQLLLQLREHPGEILVRAALEARIVRSPRQRPLLEALQEYDVLCVVPLMADGELEGVFLVPRGKRSAALTLEELSALRRHARWLSGLFGLFATRGRAEARAHAATIEHRKTRAQLELRELEAERARAALALLHAGKTRRSETPALIAYSPAMRALLAHLRSLAKLDAPVLLRAEAGTPLEPLARFVQVEAERPPEPFIVVDCSALRADQCEAAIFGSAEPGAEESGALRAADRGTLVLLDMPALTRAAQRRLGAALASGIARPNGGEDAYRLHARVIASARATLPPLLEQGRLEAELAAPFEAFTCPVPPLRDCPEDFESHVLLAIDRACRRLGREPLGIEADALSRLRQQPWRENIQELESAIDRAVAVTTGLRIGSAELDQARIHEPLEQGDRREPHPLECTLEELERRALVHAMQRAAGNKSEAARLLGLPRTTLLDKLRRHKLDDGARDSSSAPN